MHIKMVFPFFACSTTLQDCYTTIQYNAAALVVQVLHIALANEIAEMEAQECRIELPYVTQTWQHCSAWIDKVLFPLSNSLFV